MRKQINPMPFGPLPIKSPMARAYFRANVASRLSYLTTAENLSWDQIAVLARDAEKDAIDKGLEEHQFEGLEVCIRGRGPGRNYSFEGRTNGVVWLRWIDGGWKITDAYTGFARRGAKTAVETTFTSAQLQAMPERDEYWK